MFLKRNIKIVKYIHQALHDDILSKQPAFKQLTETASTLMGLVGDDEATALADRLQAATDRYDDPRWHASAGAAITNPRLYTVPNLPAGHHTTFLRIYKTVHTVFEA